MMDVPDKTRVLVVYYTYSRQALKVTEAIEGELRDRGCEVHRANIEFIDPRYAPRFAQFPLKHNFRDLFRMLPPQLRRASGEIRIPREVEEGNYDMVCFGQPTWWPTTCIPIRSLLKSDSNAKLLGAPPRVAALAGGGRYRRSN